MLWETRATGECFHSFFEFSQTFTKKKEREGPAGNHVQAHLIEGIGYSGPPIINSSSGAAGRKI